MLFCVYSDHVLEIENEGLLCLPKCFFPIPIAAHAYLLEKGQLDNQKDFVIFSCTLELEWVLTSPKWLTAKVVENWIFQFQLQSFCFFIQKKEKQVSSYAWNMRNFHGIMVEGSPFDSLLLQHAPELLTCTWGTDLSSCWLKGLFSLDTWVVEASPSWGSMGVRLAFSR